MWVIGGHTPAHFEFHYDDATDASTAPPLISAMAVRCEPDYQQLYRWFGVPRDKPGRIDVQVVPPYTTASDGTQVPVSASNVGYGPNTVQIPSDATETGVLGTLMVEVAEIFMDVVRQQSPNNAWHPGQSHGEGLSRFLGGELHKGLPFGAGEAWVNDVNPQNWVDATSTDQNDVAYGCAGIFIHWLRYELKFGVAAIVRAGASTLAGVYRNLTGRSDAWPRFIADCQRVGLPFGDGTRLSLWAPQLDDNPWPVSRASGYFIQGLFGQHGNFEAIVPSGGGGLAHVWRDNDVVPDLPWHVAEHVAEDLGHVDGACLIESSYSYPGNFEMVANVGGVLKTFWCGPDPLAEQYGWTGPLPGGNAPPVEFEWHGPGSVDTNHQLLRGRPALVQLRNGDFQMLVAAQGGELVHFRRTNWHAYGTPRPSERWTWVTGVGVGHGLVDGVALIQSNFNPPGDLEAVVSVEGELRFLWHDGHWNGPITIATGIAGQPAMVQSSLGGAPGNFEVVVPAKAGGLLHLWRDNSIYSAQSWSTGTPFGQSLGAIDDVSMIQSTFGEGNLEVLVRTGGDLRLLWREAGVWHGPMLALSGL